MEAVARDLPRVRALVEREGGLAGIVHRLLWEDGYGERLDALHAQE
jgi:hypothetical protein